jgi:hypothetical protein
MYADLLRMEQLVMASDLDWTIVRPSGLFETPSVTEYRLAEGFLPEHFTSRTDLAACMLQQAASDQYRRKTLAVATVAVKPSLAATPRPKRYSRAAATSATTTCTPRCEPGTMSVIPTPMTIEQADPGGVSCTKRKASLTC